MSPPRISVVLPTWNGEHDLRRLLAALARQEVRGGVEILAVDSSSTDGTRDVLRSAGIEPLVIPKEAFGHGRTRSMRARDARGEFLVFLSQDAEPEGADFLEELVRPFAAHPRLAGVCARVVPHERDDLLTARTVLALPEAGTEPSVWGLGGKAGLWELSAPQRAHLLRFNNVASAVRADVFRRIPFPDVPFGEDFAWAARVLTAGYELGFAPAAVARHAHAYGPLAAFERYRVDAWFHRTVHGWRMRPSLVGVLKGIAYELRADLAFARRRGLTAARARELVVRAPLLRAAQVLGQFVGSRGPAPRGWRDRPWTVVANGTP